MSLAEEGNCPPCPPGSYAHAMPVYNCHKLKYFLLKHMTRHVYCPADLCTAFITVPSLIDGRIDTAYLQMNIYKGGGGGRL